MKNSDGVGVVTSSSNNMDTIWCITADGAASTNGSESGSSGGTGRSQMLALIVYQELELAMNLLVYGVSRVLLGRMAIVKSAPSQAGQKLGAC
jgi:hypothetical protein